MHRRYTPAHPPGGFISRPIAITPALTSKIQRSVVSKHPESHDPTNCVASENPRIAIFVLNRLWIPRFRPSGRCIHARLPNVLNLTCVYEPSTRSRATDGT